MTAVVPTSAPRRADPPSSAPPPRRGRTRWTRRGLRVGIALLALVVALFGSVLGYVSWRLSQVKTAPCAACVAAAPGAPFNVLLIGSDSRQFVDNASEAGQFGSASTQTGQRSDVTIVARIVPATHQVLLLSIPRDLWVTIPGQVPGISGPNRINAAFNDGPSLLVQTIEQDLHIPINDFAEVGFPGLQGVVDALGGLRLDFPMPVKDAYTGLNITQTGCRTIDGAQALALVRSRHLYYYENGAWQADGQSDFSRIQRQDVFFRSVITQAHGKFTDPLGLNDFIGAIAHDVTVDPALKGQLISLAEQFHGVGQGNLLTETLPVTEATVNGADVLLAAHPYADQKIQAFLAFGKPAPGTKGATASTTPSVSPSQVSVRVLNGSGQNGAAGAARQQLDQAGFTVSGIADAASFSYTTSQIQYGSGGQAAARLLQSRIAGGSTLVSDPSLSGDDVVLTVGADFSGLTAGSPSSGGGSTTSTTIPPTVVTNTQTEPWNPVPCH